MTTREEIIKDAAHEYIITDKACGVGVRTQAFIDGAKWADEHPVNHWHKNIDSDLPKKSGRYLVMAQNGFCHTCKYDADSRYWDTIGYQSDIKYWMEIPELPK